MSGAYSEVFSGRGHQISSLFPAFFFPNKLILSNLSNKNDSRGSAGMLPQKSFENLHTVMAVLVLFEQFSGKFCLYFWFPILSASPNMMRFFAQFQLCVVKATQACCFKEVRNYGKILFIQNIVENGW